MLNPDKTQTTAINEARRARTKYEKEDIDVLTMDGNELEMVYEMKYLGCQITNDSSNMEHLIMKKKGAMAAISEIKTKLGYNSNECNAMLKIQYYKCYIRPVLLYGLECMNLSRKEIKEVKRHETKHIKWILQLPWCVRNEKLLRAIKLDRFIDRYNRMRLSLAVRPTLNPYTCEFIRNYYLECMKKNTTEPAKANWPNNSMIKGLFQMTK